MSKPAENYDWLTGIKNLKWAKEKLTTLVAHSTQVALILIDIDGMKRVNDILGHPTGDVYITNIADNLQDICGVSTWPFRCGGDEFGVILDKYSVEQARELAQKICLSHQPVQLGMYNGEKIQALTLSLGIAHFPTHVSDSDSLIRAADLALLKAKRGGRLPDGTPYIGRNRVMAIGDFLDEFPEQSAKFLKPA